MESATIIGTWNLGKAENAREFAEKIGGLVAEKGLSLVSGGGEGISKLVVEAYKKKGGKNYVAYFPSKEFMDKVGENKGLEPDKEVLIEGDYPLRNIHLVKNSEVIIALNGGLGTLTEIIYAIKDYDIPVIVIDFGELARFVRAIPELLNKVILTKDFKKISEVLINGSRI